MQLTTRPRRRAQPRLPPTIRLLAPHLFSPSPNCRPHKRPGRKSFKRGRIQYLKRLENAKKHWEKKALMQPRLRGNALVLLERGPSPLSSISTISAWNDERPTVTGDEGTLLSDLYYGRLRAATRKTLWQHNAPRLDADNIYDVEWDNAGALENFGTSPVLNPICWEEPGLNELYMELDIEIRGLDLGLHSSDFEILELSGPLAPAPLNGSVLGWDEPLLHVQGWSESPTQTITGWSPSGLDGAANSQAALTIERSVQNFLTYNY
ncbi:hypothetical protein L218DRAFT_1075646 [Marasmius fiardii PR-910]|nr:hypothetical protein L218DRAFT_1075646 [Marasmius fiardii PR-910]